MSNPKIALDHDSTLAATSETAFELLEGPDHDYSYRDIESWVWGLNEFGKKEYLSAMWNAWTIRPLEVPTTEPNLDDAVARLRESGQVDIVTSHPDYMGIQEGKEEWLAKHSIPYDSFVSVTDGESKAEYDYDYYIDDKPALPSKVDDGQVLLINQPYNQQAEGDYVRVDTVLEATEIIENND